MNQKPRKHFKRRGASVLVCAFFMVLMYVQPASADNQWDIPDVPEFGGWCLTCKIINNVKDKASGPETDQTQTESDIAKQCDSKKEVPETFSDSWAGLVPAVIGCAAITSLDWTVGKLGLALDATTINLTQDTGRNNNKWFGQEYSFLVTVTIWTIPPIYLIALLQALATGHLDKMLKITLGYLPMAVIGTVVGIVVVQQMLFVTDDIASVFQQSVQRDTEKFMVAIARGFGPDGFVVRGKTFLMAEMLGLGLLLATAVIYIILSLREASIYIAALFLPFGFAMLIWPALHKYFKKLVEFLFGMIISKIIMVAAISLMVAAMTSIAGQQSTAAMSLGLDGAQLSAQQSAQGTASWVAQTITLIFTFFIVAFAPNIPSKLFANVSFEDSGRHQASMQNRPDTKRKIDWFNRMIGVAEKIVPLHNAFSQYAGARQAGLEMDGKERQRVSLGLSAQKEEVTEETLKRHGFRLGDGTITDSHEAMNNAAAHIILRLAESDNLDNQRLAQYFLAVGGDRMESFELNVGDVSTRDMSAAEIAELGPEHFGVGGYAVIHSQRERPDGTKRRRVDMIFRGFDDNNNPVDVHGATIRRGIENQIAWAQKLGAPVAEIIVHVPGDLGTSGRDLNSNSRRHPTAAAAGRHGLIFGRSDPRLHDIQVGAMVDQQIEEVMKAHKEYAGRIRRSSQGVATGLSNSKAERNPERFPVS